MKMLITPSVRDKYEAYMLDWVIRLYRYMIVGGGGQNIMACLDGAPNSTIHSGR